MMYESSKLITLGLAILLLSPFAVIFWRGARFVPLSDPSRMEDRHDMRRSLQEAVPAQLVEPPALDEDHVLARVEHHVVEAIGLYRTAPLWLCFYPRRSVGIVGLLAVLTVLLCTAIFLFVPNSVEIDP